MALTDGSVLLRDVTVGSVRHTLQGSSLSLSLIAFTPAGDLVAVGAEDGELRLWDTNTGQPAHTLGGHTSMITCAAFSPDGRTLASGSDSTIKLHDIPTGQELLTLSAQRDIRSIAFTRDGAGLISAGSTEKGQVAVLQWLTGPISDLHAAK